MVGPSRTPARHLHGKTGGPARQGRRYLDCALPAYKICLEYDGDLHLTDVQKHDDIIRDQTLRRLGWHTIRVT